jgi:hypothetical protein
VRPKKSNVFHAKHKNYVLIQKEKFVTVAKSGNLPVDKGALVWLNYFYTAKRL